jgi:hypothetical protein
VKLLSLQEGVGPSIRCLTPGSLHFHLWDLFEVEISQVHITVRQYVHGENISPFVETNLEKLRSQIPVVPLTPGQRVCGIICRRNLQRSGGVVSIHID